MSAEHFTTILALVAGHYCPNDRIPLLNAHTHAGAHGTWKNTKEFLFSSLVRRVIRDLDC